MEQADGLGEWQRVSRWKPKPYQNPIAAPTIVKPYIPYKPLYSQITSSHPTSPTPAAPKPPSNQNQSLIATSPPSSPPSKQATLPSSSQFSEWKGRCFRCFHTGHNQASCRNPMRCGKYWGEGYVSNRCTGKHLNPAALPYWTNQTRLAAPTSPLKKPIDDILLKPCPLAAPSMPNNRPKRLSSFLDKYLDLSTELTRLNNSVVFDTHGKEPNLNLEDVAGFVTRTKLVDKHEISISLLSTGRFIITLPPGLAIETFINATSLSLWDAGFSFQPWSTLDWAALKLPEYKVLLLLEWTSPHLHKESIIARAVSTFGIFLRSVKQPESEVQNLSLYTVAVAVDCLERVPIELEINAEG